MRRALVLLSIIMLSACDEPPCIKSEVRLVRVSELLMFIHVGGNLIPIFEDKLARRMVCIEWEKTK